jgi:hypothetical protein
VPPLFVLGQIVATPWARSLVAYTDEHENSDETQREVRVLKGF